jgi:general L-amino acid transport system permease protein
MSSAAAARASRPPLWRDVRVLRVVGQVLFIAVIVVIAREMYLNATVAIEASGRSLTFGYLQNRAGFGIKETILNYSSNQPFYRAFMAAATNAMMVAFVGIIMATILGLFIGIARLSTNWLVRKVAQVYVELFRNVPALVQIVFWYTAVILAIPRIQNSLSVFDIAFVSNRGAAIPAVRGGADFGVWWALVAVGLVGAWFVWRRRTAVNETTGEPSYRWLWSAGAVIGVGALGYILLGDAFFIEVPELGERRYTGGIQMSPEFAGILLGLTIYTAAFIGEIVRGSILAVSKGQKEAAQALGLRPGQQLRLVVLPQALRTAVPSITNQYLNLWKNTSLAFIIGFPEIVNVSNTMINQGGHPLENFALVVGTYLGVSLAISAVMNVFNRLVALRGGR